MVPKERPEHSAIASWLQQRANSERATTPLVYSAFLQQFLNITLVEDVQAKLQAFVERIRSYYQNIVQTLGTDRVEAFKPTDNIPNEGRSVLDHTKGLTWRRVAESALTKVRSLEEHFLRTRDASCVDLIRFMMQANDLMDAGALLGEQDRLIELRGVCYALIREVERTNNAELAENVITYCALRNALRSSPKLRPHIGL